MPKRLKKKRGLRYRLSKGEAPRLSPAELLLEHVSDVDLARSRTHGTRIAAVLGGAREMKDLGRHFGADLTEAEMRYLVRHEWARSAQDILWRRTRLGLALPASAVNDLQDAVDRKSVV